jgi:hypothetical protein
MHLERADWMDFFVFQQPQFVDQYFVGFCVA